MKLFKLRGIAIDEIRDKQSFFGTVLVNDGQNSIAAKKIFSAQLRQNSDIDVSKISYSDVEEVKNGFVFATHYQTISN